jgi:glucose dehydrogenase
VRVCRRSSLSRALCPYRQSTTFSLADGTSKGEWSYYTGDVRGTRFSPLDQISASNFNKLEVAWRFRPTTSARVLNSVEGTPLMIKGVIYTTAPARAAR